MRRRWLMSLSAIAMLLQVAGCDKKETTPQPQAPQEKVAVSGESSEAKGKAAERMIPGTEVTQNGVKVKVWESGHTSGNRMVVVLPSPSKEDVGVMALLRGLREYVKFVNTKISSEEDGVYQSHKHFSSLKVGKLILEDREVRYKITGDTSGSHWVWFNCLTITGKGKILISMSSLRTNSGKSSVGLNRHALANDQALIKLLAKNGLAVEISKRSEAEDGSLSVVYNIRQTQQ